MAERKQNKSTLSKEALALLDEIEAEEKSSLEAKRRSDKFTRPHLEPTSLETRGVYSKAKRFSLDTYDEFTKGPTAFIWLGGLAFIILIVAILFMKLSLLHQHDLVSNTLTQSEIKEENADLERRLASIEKNNTEVHKTFNSLSAKFPNKLQAQGYLDDVIRLFEQSNLTIIKQQVVFQSSPSQVKAQDLDLEKPSIEKNVFVSEDTKSQDKSSSSRGGLIDQIKNKPVISSLLNRVPMKLGGGNLPVQVVNKNSVRLNFLSFTLIIKGKYTDYQLARSTLARLIPSVSIPLEQIVILPQRSDVEMKVVFDIPFIND